MTDTQIVKDTLGLNPMRGKHYRFEWFNTADASTHSFAFGGDSLAAVADAVHQGKIGVAVNAAIPAKALYLPKRHTIPGVGALPANHFILSRAMTTGINDQMVIVHEGTHALCDMRANVMNALFAEIVAYVVQSLYHRVRMNSGFRHGAMYTAADDVAQALLDSRTPAPADLELMGTEIEAVSDYADYRSRTTDYNGL
ncbi:MAG: hypothetical protein AAF074_22200 [Pseudomonadota bacterium]